MAKDGNLMKSYIIHKQKIEYSYTFFYPRSLRSWVASRLIISYHSLLFQIFIKNQNKNKKDSSTLYLWFPRFPPKSRGKSPESTLRVQEYLFFTSPVQCPQGYKGMVFHVSCECEREKIQDLGQWALNYFSRIHWRCRWSRCKFLNNFLIVDIPYSWMYCCFVVDNLIFEFWRQNSCLHGPRSTRPRLREQSALAERMRDALCGSRKLYKRYVVFSCVFCFRLHSYVWILDFGGHW